MVRATDLAHCEVDQCNDARKELQKCTTSGHSLLMARQPKLASLSMQAGVAASDGPPQSVCRAHEQHNSNQECSEMEAAPP